MGGIIGFSIWCIVGCALIGIGIYSAFSKKPMGFWANAKAFEVTDTKKYNRAVAKLFCAYGIGFNLLGIPLLLGQTWALLSILGVVVETISMMVVYTTVIEKKYRK